MMHDSNECERVGIKIKRCDFKPYSATDRVTLRKPFKLSLSSPVKNEDKNSFLVGSQKEFNSSLK